MSETITVEGDERFRATMDHAADGIENLTQAPTEAGNVVRLRAATLAPKATATLSRSISATTTNGEAVIGSGLDYAGPMEFGVPGHGIAAHPYMRPALADSTGAVVAAYGNDVQKQLDTVHGT